MNSKHQGFRRFVYVITFSILCLLVYSSSIGVVMGQKKPGSLNQGTTSDDKKLCEKGNNDDSEFCGFYQIYADEMDSNPELAQKARNRMIDLVQWQIEIYYKMRKDDRKKLVARLQMIFDILEIGTTAATGIITGTLRAKSVMAQALSGFQAGRTATNRNFDVLQTQVLINTMNTNRAEIATGIENSKKLDVDEYTWYKAKEDLTKLLNAGTFSDALDTLVKKTGADAEKAEAILKAVTKKDVSESRETNKIFMNLRKALQNTETRDDATRILREIVADLSQDEEISTLLSTEGVTTASDGEIIRLTLIKVRGDLVVARRNDLVIKINKAIRAVSTSIE